MRSTDSSLFRAVVNKRAEPILLSPAKLTYDFVHVILDWLGFRGRGGWEGLLAGMSVALLASQLRCNLSHCRSNRQIDFKYKTYRSVHPLFGRRALSGKELSGGTPDILRVKTRCNLSHCRSNRQIDFKHNSHTEVFTHCSGDAP